MKKLMLFIMLALFMFSQQIETITLSPPRITQNTDIRAEVTPPALPEGYRYSYTWYVNGLKLDYDSPTLPSGNFKKGDFVWVGVYILDEDGNKIDYGESLRYKIADIPPQILNSPPSVDKLKPGDKYKYKIEVKDEDDPVEEVKVELKKGPKDAKIEENTLKWVIPKKRGEYEFIIEAKDPDGEICQLSYKISVSVKKEKGR